MVFDVTRLGLLTIALALLAPGVLADGSQGDVANAEDGSRTETTEPPCDAIKIRLEWPYIDVHPECIELPPSLP